MNKVEKAIMSINEIKSTMIKNGNEISKIVYSISDELNERNACRDFANKTGMSKASISKMVYAERARKEYYIIDTISYNTIYKLKDIMREDIALMLNDGMTEQEIRNTLVSGIETEVEETEVEETEVEETEVEETEVKETEVEVEETETEVEKNAKVLRSQILDILSDYDIEKDDLKLIKSLLKALR